MKALFIGGTGTISTSVTKQALKKGWELTHLNRGQRAASPEGLETIHCNVRDEEAVQAALKGRRFDAVFNFIGYTAEQVERDYRIFRDKTDQYLYVSSAAAYAKPCASPYITEGTVQGNRFWQYARDKIAAEHFLLTKHREESFPVTIVRPSHTYSDRALPVGVQGRSTWQVARRMLEGKQVIMHGDGTSLWTMTHADDVAVGFVGLMGKPEAIGEVFGVTSSETLTWNQIYTHIANALGVPYKPYYVTSTFVAETSPYGADLWGDKANCVIFDTTKIRRIVPEFNPTIGFAEGARRTVSYILDHPECQTSDPAYDAWCDRVIAVQEKAKAELIALNEQAK